MRVICLYVVLSFVFPCGCVVVLTLLCGLYMPPRGRSRCRGGRGRGRGEPASEDPPANLDMAAILAEMQTMRAEMNALR
jgi:hypothetical protein